jgi:hypothetical protein
MGETVLLAGSEERGRGRRFIKKFVLRISKKSFPVQKRVFITKNVADVSQRVLVFCLILS